jgi:hypothetical protein
LGGPSPPASDNRREYHLFAYSDQGCGGIRSTNARRVHVSARHRRDLGDIGELANSMRDPSERYEVSRSSGDPTQQVVRIKWDSDEGHLSGFRQSPEFRRFFEAVGPFVHDIQDMRRTTRSGFRARRGRDGESSRCMSTSPVDLD